MPFEPGDRKTSIGSTIYYLETQTITQPAIHKYFDNILCRVKSGGSHRTTLGTQTFQLFQLKTHHTARIAICPL